MVKITELDQLPHSNLLVPEESCGDSSIYVVGNQLYKILDSNYRTEREPVIDYLGKNPIDDCANPTEKLMFHHHFHGFAMPYDETLIGLDEELSNDIEWSIKLDLVKKYLKIAEKVEEQELIYHDHNLGNIVTDRNRVLLVDIDSVILPAHLSKHEFNWYQNKIRITSTLTALSFLYQFDFQEWMSYKCCSTEYFEQILNLPFSHEQLIYLSACFKQKNVPYMSGLIDELPEHVLTPSFIQKSKM